MSDLEERVACMQVRLYKYDIGEKLAKELIAMFKQDAVEAIENAYDDDFTDWQDIAKKAINQL